MVPPLIAIPTYHLDEGRVRGWSRGGFAVPDTYVAAVHRAGGRAVLLPAGPVTLEPFDALLLAGGGDVDPDRYGAPAHAATYGVDGTRDELEVGLVHEAQARRLPTLAICRGVQLLNVALGGSLHQHVPQLPGALAHGQPLFGGSVEHEVKVAEGTRLAAAVGTHLLEGATSHHHQAIDRLGEGLAAVAWAGDGVIEGIEPEAADWWCVGVQWHPEYTAANDPVQQALFDTFVSQIGP